MICLRQEKFHADGYVTAPAGKPQTHSSTSALHPQRFPRCNAAILPAVFVGLCGVRIANAGAEKRGPAGTRLGCRAEPLGKKARVAARVGKEERKVSHQGATRLLPRWLFVCDCAMSARRHFKFYLKVVRMGFPPRTGKSACATPPFSRFLPQVRHARIALLWLLCYLT